MAWRERFRRANQPPSPRAYLGRVQEIAVFLLILATLVVAGTTEGLSWPALLVSLVTIALRAAGLRFSTNVGCALLLGVLGLVPLYWYVGIGWVDLGIRDLLVAVLMVFVLSARTGRDFAALSSYCLWILLASLFPVSGPAQWMAVGFVFGWFLLVQSLNEIRRSGENAPTGLSTTRRDLWPLLGLLSLALVGIAGIAVALYVALPRNPLQAYSIPFQPIHRLVGFSNSVRLGEIGELQKDRTPAFRVRFLQGAPPPLLRWRGTALADFNGYAWMNKLETWREFPERGRISVASDEQRRLPGTRLFYEVQNLAAMDRVVFSAGVAEYVFLPDGHLRVNGEGALRQWLEGNSVGGYSLAAWQGVPGNFDAHPPAGDVTTALSDVQRRRYLRLPRLNERLPDLAQSITAKARNDYQKAFAIEEHLRTQYAYSLQAGIGRRDPLTDFLFISKAGHCEYFASAMAVLLRQVGIPSRVVTGFYTALPEPVGDWYVIRSADAHSWVEAYIAGRGWLTFDPTPPGAASEVSAISAWMHRMEDRMLILSEDWMGGAAGLHRPRLPRWPEMKEWGATAEAAARQAAPWTAAALLLVAAGLLWRQRRRRAAGHDATQMFETFLATSGLARLPHQTAREAAPGYAELFRAYEAARFSGQASALAELRRKLAEYAAQTNSVGQRRGAVTRANRSRD